MDCERAEKLLQPYVQGTLQDKELENFIAHIEECPACYDELETYFIINHAIRYLDDAETKSYDLKDLLKKDIVERKKMIFRRKCGNIFFGVVMITLSVVVITFTMHYLGFLKWPWPW